MGDKPGNKMPLENQMPSNKQKRLNMFVHTIEPYVTSILFSRATSCFIILE